MTTLFTILIAIIIALLCIAWGLAIRIRWLEKRLISTKKECQLAWEYYQDVAKENYELLYGEDEDD